MKVTKRECFFHLILSLFVPFKYASFLFQCLPHLFCFSTDQTFVVPIMNTFHIYRYCGFFWGGGAMRYTCNSGGLILLPQFIFVSSFFFFFCCLFDAKWCLLLSFCHFNPLSFLERVLCVLLSPVLWWHTFASYMRDELCQLAK